MLDAYEERVVRFAEDLINTYDPYLDVPEHLREPGDLQHFADTRGVQLGSVNQADLEQVRGLRSFLRAIWEAETLDEATRMLNMLFANIGVFVQVEPGSAGKLRFQFQVLPDTTVVQRLAVEAATGIVIALQEYGVERLRACAAEPCRDAFIDISRNQSRRFCSERCANRHNTAAFRQRQRKQADGA